MFGLKKSPLRILRHKSAEAEYPVASGSNPFDDDELHNKQKVNPSRTSSEPELKTPNFSSNPFDDDEIKGNSSSSSAYARTSAEKNKYKNDFHDSGGIENQSVQELENYAVYKAEETTKTVNSCLKIAEDIREDATKTLVTLHHQGEQITRTHMVAADIEHDLSRGEKLLGSLGGMFSKTWKPKKTHTITGPVTTTRDDPSAKRISHMEHREKLGLAPAPRGRASRTPPPEPTNALEQVEVEKGKQDDGLTDLSNLLGELKEMAIDMGSEIERHNKALDPLYNDIDELNYRVQGANQRTRRLLGK